MVSGGDVVAVISTLLVTLFAIYHVQINSPTVLSVSGATDFELGEQDPDFCPVSADPSSCLEGASSKMGDPSNPTTTTTTTSEDGTLYDLSYTSIDGTEESMQKYRDHVLIVVNVASKCGYTCVNYEQLTELFDKYSESEGLRILAFPCNQFMGQEPLGEKEIKEFAATYNVQYDMGSKVDVNGDNTHPVWKFLKKRQGGFMGDFIKWNFTKFLVDKKGNVVKRYSPTTNPRELEKDLLTYFKETT